MKRLAFGFATVAASAAPALVHAAPARHDPVIGEPESASVVHPGDITRVVYLNNCQPNGCLVRPGQTDSRTDTSKAAGTEGSLGAFMYSDDQFAAIASCMRDVLAPFNLQVTTTDPQTAPHFEIMIAGLGSEIGEESGVLGVSPYACKTNSATNPTGLYIDNTLVFAFANDPYYATSATTVNTEELCATAAQELAHSFALDHVTDASDPLTYNPFSGRRYYQDHKVCGSDCGSTGTPGVSPTGYTCTGTDKQEHPCVCANGDGNQDDVQIMLALFGPGTPVVPTVTLSAPASGATVHPGAHLEGAFTMDALFGSAVMKLDGTMIDSFATPQLVANLPQSTTMGSHTLELDVTDNHGTTGTASVTFNVMPAAQLGETCTGNGDCATNECAKSSGDERCVQACDDASNPCPSGFDCLAAGTGGVCWPASGGGGGGGCDTRGTPGAPILLGLAFGALVLLRRKSA